MTPWDYVRLRREAARLTIEQAAKPFCHRPEHLADIERNMRGWEQPGAIMSPWVAAGTVRAFPFDYELYRILCTTPADQPLICTRCACTDDDAPIARDGHPGRVGPDGLCTACREKPAAQPSLL